MDTPNNVQPELRQQARSVLEQLAPDERESLLIKNWMSHDARWFVAVAREFGMAATNRINQSAAHEVGKVEAQRILRALGPAACGDAGRHSAAPGSVHRLSGTRSARLPGRQDG